MTSFTPSTSIRNRRRFIRVPANCKVAAQKILFFARGDSELWGEAKNIGAGGILFVSDRQCHKDDMLKVTMTLPANCGDYPRLPDIPEEGADIPITAVCQVLRDRRLRNGRFELAVKFVNIFRDEMKGLKDFIEAEAERLGVMA